LSDIISDMTETKDAKQTTMTRRGCWNWAIDEASSQRYFYNKFTKEVMWDMPPSYIEWKVALD